MRKAIVLAASVLTATAIIAGCSKTPDETSAPTTTTAATTAATTFEPQHKTETETRRVDQGMIPQVIEEKVSYVQKTADGNWEVESKEITKWTWDDNFQLPGTAWYIETSDVTAVSTYLDSSLKGTPGKAYFRFQDKMDISSVTINKDADGTEKLSIETPVLWSDMLLDCGMVQTIYTDVKVLGGDIYQDGTAKMRLESDKGEVILTIPADVKSIDTNEFLEKMPDEFKVALQSQTYIRDISAFKDLATFDLSSALLHNGVWDEKITNTSFGQNISPDLRWTKVEGASQYVVIMIDGNWLHMDVFTEETSLEEGAFDKGKKGGQYVGPYPPSGTHTYSVFVFALKDPLTKVKLKFNLGGNDINSIFYDLDLDKDGNKGNVLSYARLDGNYTYHE